MPGKLRSAENDPSLNFSLEKWRATAAENFQSYALDRAPFRFP
jgi:hypothetical protein